MGLWYSMFKLQWTISARRRRKKYDFRISVSLFPLQKCLFGSSEVNIFHLICCIKSNTGFPLSKFEISHNNKQYNSGKMVIIEKVSLNES